MPRFCTLPNTHFKPAALVFPQFVLHKQPGFYSTNCTTHVLHKLVMHCDTRNAQEHVSERSSAQKWRWQGILKVIRGGPGGGGAVSC